jgi:hypothetical protein
MGVGTWWSVETGLNMTIKQVNTVEADIGVGGYAAQEWQV